MERPAPESRRSSSAFLIAAIALPLIVVAVFLVASAVPRWTVAPPSYDFLFRANNGYNPTTNQTLVNFVVREGSLVADVRPAAPNTYPVHESVFLFDHRTLTATEIRLDLPSRLEEGETLRTIPVASLATRRVLEGPKAPDGYTFDTRYQGGPGLVGELFGMNRHGPRASIVKSGRVVTIAVSDPFRYSIQAIGWLAAEGQ